MNKLFTLFFIGFLSTSLAQSSKKIKVLFIGNSYTYVNNLPQLVKDIALANGDTLIADSNCPGGFTFLNHTNDPTSVSKITGLQWKYVILQAQSQEPSFSPAQVNAQTLPYAIRLDSMVKSNNPCGTTVFYETWGRKFGDASNCPAYPPICTYLGMQNRLKASYKLFADTTKGIVSPVGEAFRASIASNPGLELYQPDQSHPSLEGSYLAAAVFYELLFQKSVLNNTYNPGLSTFTLSFLQQIAHTTLRDSLATWNIGNYHPWADFTYTTNPGSACQFTGLSAGTSNLWYFGDGNTATGVSSSHNYAVSGNYTVSHVAYTNCKKDSVSKVISVTASSTNGIYNYQDSHTLSVFPNPVENELYIQNFGELHDIGIYIELFDVSGRLILKMPYSNKINTANLAPGIYSGKINHPAGKQYFKFVKAG